VSGRRPLAPREWFTLGELAGLKLPGLPSTAMGMHRLAGRERWAADPSCARKRTGRGGGIEYHLSLLPEAAKARLMAAQPAEAQAPESVSRESAWMRYERLPASCKAAAITRLAMIQRVEALQRGGLRRGRAVEEVTAGAARDARAKGQDAPFSPSTLYGWLQRIEGVAVADRLAYLAPDYAGRTALAPCDRAALDAYISLYLREDLPTHARCYRDVRRLAAEHGWTLPSAKTLQRRLDAEVPAAVQILRRKGEQALSHAYPHLQRDRSGIRPMQIGNLDGHTWDVRVAWPDGTVSRPLSLAVQDIASGKVLAIRFDQTLNQHLVRLALGDAFRDFGLFETLIMDNGRENAAKAISGGQSTRWRWKVRAEEPAGLLKQLGVEAVFATPYWGQAKPVERAFRDFAGDIAKHPSFSGAYTGKDTASKPSNYGERAIPLAEFEAVVREELALHNARLGRRGWGMAGRSFDQVFAEGIARHAPRWATPEQLRMCLLAADEVGLDPRDNSVKVFGHRYWSEALSALKRQRVTVRFDPEDLSAPVYVYALNGKYLGEARRIEAGSFDRVADAQAQRRRVRAFKAATKAQAEALVRMSPAELGAALRATAPAPETTPTAADPKVVRPAFGAPRTPEQAGPSFDESWQRGVAALAGGG
jgi:putative transposase